MFEFNQYESALHHASLAKATSYVYCAEVDLMSLLFWGEHCTECAAPACYSTCDLYQKRPDNCCRRFTFGMYKNAAFPSLRGYGVEIRFKKWGALKARASVNMVPTSRVLGQELLAEKVLPVMDTIGGFASSLSRDDRWARLSSALLSRLLKWQRQRNNVGPQPDAFLLEIYNPTSETIKIQLRMNPVVESNNNHGLVTLRKTFAATVQLGPGYTRHVFDRHLFQALIDSGEPFDISLMPDGEQELTLVFLTADFVAFRKDKLSATRLPNIKCIVWDLDNTLWDGILLEGENARPRAQVVELIKSLDKRGILMSIASKNDQARASEVLKEFGLDEYFLYPQVNWMPKSQNIQHIARQLNIGLDTFAFVDDNPFELAEVKHALPMVTCINTLDIQGIMSNSRFEGSSSDDAKHRRQYYMAAMQRVERKSQYGEDYIGFLADCTIRLTIKIYSADDLDRVVELVQRTNQLNFSGRKYTRSEVVQLLQRPAAQKYVLICSDRYGSYGTIGFCVVNHRQHEIEIDDFMLSCRVQGKFIEGALVSHLVARHSTSSTSRIRVNYQQSEKNRPARQVLDMLKFVDEGKGKGFSLDLSSQTINYDFITVECLSCNASPLLRENVIVSSAEGVGNPLLGSPRSV